ncbi:hypothetical protein LPJ53_006399, partial [Coemansia erecta]
MNMAESSVYRGGVAGGIQAKNVMYPPPTLEQFNLTDYLNEYTGVVKIRRALYTGERCAKLAIPSYSAALEELRKNTRNVALYEEVIQRLQQLGVNLAKDIEWVNKTRNENVCMRDEFKTNVIKAVAQGQKKESLNAQKELAHKLTSMGLIDEAVRAWQDAREYCVSIEDQAMLSIEVARISQNNGRWMQVANFAQRTAQTLAKSTNTEVKAEIDVLQMQASIGEGRWLPAINSIRALPYDGTANSGLFALGAIAPQDIALYGSLAGLASLSREKVKKDLIDSPAFGKYLDHMPECGRLLRSFYASKYSECLAHLDNVLSLAALDVVLGLHVSKLKAVIRENIVVLYTQPFVSSNLESMAKALRFDSAQALEELLVGLIERKLIHARIDGTSGYLVKY